MDAFNPVSQLLVLEAIRRFSSSFGQTSTVLQSLNQEPQAKPDNKQGAVQEVRSHAVAPQISSGLMGNAAKVPARCSTDSEQSSNQEAGGEQFSDPDGKASDMNVHPSDTHGNNLGSWIHPAVNINHLIQLLPARNINVGPVSSEDTSTATLLSSLLGLPVVYPPRSVSDDMQL